MGLSTEEVAAIEAVAELVVARPGETIVREGDEGDRVFFVLSGAVSVQMRLEDGRRHRLSTYGPGLSVGELALLEGQRRTADVVADEESVLACIGVAELESVGSQVGASTAANHRGTANHDAASTASATIGTSNGRSHCPGSAAPSTAPPQ